jgi:hypothetical protein
MPEEFTDSAYLVGADVLSCSAVLCCAVLCCLCDTLRAQTREQLA